MKYFIAVCSLTLGLCASDTVTMGNLMWQDNSEAKSTKLNWKDANAYCQDLDLAGHSDWKLPSIKELQSIVDVSRCNPAIKKEFKNIDLIFVLSSSQYAFDIKYAWIVYFGNGATAIANKTNEYYVRCVRHRQ